MKPNNKQINKMETVKIDINKKVANEKIIKKESGIYQTEHGTLLYKPDSKFDCLCLSCDKELIVHLTKLLISSTVLLFSMVMLWYKNGDSAFYSSTISLILGTFLGTQMNQNNNNNSKNSKNIK